MKKLILFSFIFLSLHSFAQSLGASIVYVDGNGNTYDDNALTSMNFSPCQNLKFRVNVSNIPANYHLCSVEWYDGGFVDYPQSTTTEITLPITKSGQIVACTVTIGTGTAPSCNNSSGVIANGVHIYLYNVTLTTPTSSTTAFNVGCTNNATFTSSIASNSAYVPASGTYTLAWSVPSGWASNPSNFSTMVTPDQASGGNISLNLKLNACSYNVSSAPYAVTRGVPAPAFSASNTYSNCTGGTKTYSIVGQCGAASYTYSITGNTSCTFTATGSQTYTTTQTSADISFPQSGSYSITLSVKANYPNGTSSSAQTATISSGLPDATKLSIVTSNTTVCANQPIALGARYNGSCINSSNTAGITTLNWYVSPTPPRMQYNSGMSGCAAGVNNSNVQIAFTSQSTVRISAQNACGTSAQSSPLLINIQSGCKQGIKYSISPNPAQSYMTVAIQPLAESADDQPQVFYRVKVTDRFGVTRKVFENKVGYKFLRIPVADLYSGTYLVSVFDGVSWTSQSLIIQK